MKRLLDLLALLLTLPIWLPLLVATAVMVRLRLGAPMLFCQTRSGRSGRPFKLFKFRTMTNARDADGELLPDEQRLTDFGRWLRSTSADELPSMLNVIRGEMSLVGPRPFVVEYLPLYNIRQTRRHDVLPGVTGWAQINGRNSLTWAERLEMDVWYVENRTHTMDLRIIAASFGKVLRRGDVAAEGHVTMEPFKGSEEIRT